MDRTPGGGADKGPSGLLTRLHSRVLPLLFLATERGGNRPQVSSQIWERPCAQVKQVEIAKHVRQEVPTTGRRLQGLRSFPES